MYWTIAYFPISLTHVVPLFPYLAVTVLYIFISLSSTSKFLDELSNLQIILIILCNKQNEIINWEFFLRV